MRDFILVGLGGFVGSALRYGVAVLFSSFYASRLYLGTLAVNLLGSLLIGILIGLLSKNQSQLSLFLVVGFCGGFTTFSTFSMDGIKLLRNQLYAEYFLYASLSIFGGLALCLLGHYLSSKG